jgi:hypothetical protein
VPTSFAKATKKLEQFVRTNIELDAPDAKGISKRKHIASWIKQYKKVGKDTTDLEEQIKRIDLDPVSLHLVKIFNDLTQTRSSGFAGPQPITYLEIKAYRDLMGESFGCWEVETLRRMDTILIETEENKNKKRESHGSLQHQGDSGLRASPEGRQGSPAFRRVSKKG